MKLTDLNEYGGFRTVDDMEIAPHKFNDLKIPPPGDPTLSAWLTHTFSDEENYGGANGDGNVASVLGNGEDWAICTSWANMVQSVLPDRTQVMGFWIDDNPTATKIGDVCSGHDFAVVDKRYIVDGWIANVEAMTNQVVFDLKDPSHAEIIQGYYGDPSTWKVV